jgi:zinc-ribbon domain
MKFCPECGIQNEDGVAFCGECGAAIESDTSSSNNQIKTNYESGLKGYIKAKKLTTKKGIILIVVGVVGFFILSELLSYIFFRLLNLYTFYDVFKLFFLLIKITSILIFIFGIVVLILNEQKGTLVNNNTEKFSKKNDSVSNTPKIVETITLENSNITNMQYENRVVKVDFTGGLIGALAQNQTAKLNTIINSCNEKGWEVVQIVEDRSGNLLVSLFRAILLIITLFLFTFEDGYKIVLRRIKK